MFSVKLTAMSSQCPRRHSCKTDISCSTLIFINEVSTKHLDEGVSTWKHPGCFQMWREDTMRLPSESPKQRPHSCFIAAAKPVVRCPGGDNGSIVGLLVYNSMPSVEYLCTHFNQVNTPEHDKPEVFAPSLFEASSIFSQTKSAEQIQQEHSTKHETRQNLSDIRICFLNTM